MMLYGYLLAEFESNGSSYAEFLVRRKHNYVYIASNGNLNDADDEAVKIQNNEHENIRAEQPISSLNH